MTGYQSWIDKQIAQAQAEGKFDNLAGSGKPLDLSDDSEYWWVRKLMKREGLSYLPPTLQLRKDAELTLAAIKEMTDEDDVRQALRELNDRIADAIRTPQSGPPLGLSPVNADAVVQRWRATRG
ncbi:DUF1992 domain-containing protein [Blastococcus sp. Marseille-P5729]|uniref:DnaJ family domain-containing protein n=1 Tax=Blastococcus sp. Marseille-P5729 TaxID=2086582 RepID=UPI000D0F5CBB|nr:DUF1992 domain-containing protein [Blastococcus sp. Marseille-P5729]